MNQVDVMKIFCMLLVIVIAWLDTLIKSYWNVHFKWIHFTECNVSLTMLSKQILHMNMRHSDMMWKPEEIQWTFWALGFFSLTIWIKFYLLHWNKWCSVSKMFIFNKWSILVCFFLFRFLEVTTFWPLQSLELK